ncbi:hypothetical protein ACHWQZ_G018023 [Mnemiopsis leidyi]
MCWSSTQFPSSHHLTTDNGIITSSRISTSQDVECTIDEYRGFLKYVCSGTDSRKTLNKCHNTNEVYLLKVEGFFNGQLCSNDPHFYYACQKNTDDKTYGILITNNDVLCGQYLCKQEDGITRINLEIPEIHCNGKQDCTNTDLDEMGCFIAGEVMTTMPSGKAVPATHICDDVCDDLNCEDEASCNGYMYGLYCDLDMTKNTKTYIPPHKMCDRTPDCLDKSDESKICSVTNETEHKCQRSEKVLFFWQHFAVPVFNFTKCYAVQVRNFWNDARYCFVGNSFVSDQTNCTDPGKVGLSCLVNGFMTTVSKQVICSRHRQQVCDDNLEKVCTKCSETCFVHKHLMCDGKLDCEDETDETHPSCLKMTGEKCKRRVGQVEKQPVPHSWLGDGFKDCEDGRDEMNVWPTCGIGKSLRFVISNETCENVFVCPWDEPGFVELDDLCDGVQTCGNENAVCSRTNGFEPISTAVLTTEWGLKKNVAFCMRGLEKIQKFDNMKCSTEISDSFIYPPADVFGIQKTKIILPSALRLCDHMFGEMFVFTSLNKCYNSSCPIRNIPRYEACPGQYPNRIGTIFNNSFLIFVTKSFGDIYTNNYFVCDNNIKCIDYSHVCNLVDDCGDGSDEEICTNHFKCDST